MRLLGADEKDSTDRLDAAKTTATCEASAPSCGARGKGKDWPCRCASTNEHVYTRPLPKESCNQVTPHKLLCRYIFTPHPPKIRAIKTQAACDLEGIAFLVGCLFERIDQRFVFVTARCPAPRFLSSASSLKMRLRPMPAIQELDRASRRTSLVDNTPNIPDGRADPTPLKLPITRRPHCGITLRLPKRRTQGGFTQARASHQIKASHRPRKGSEGVLQAGRSASSDFSFFKNIDQSTFTDHSVAFHQLKTSSCKIANRIHARRYRTGRNRPASPSRH